MFAAASPMRLFDSRTFAALLTTLLVAGALWVIWAARRPLLAFLFAIFFAYLLEPLVERVHRTVHGPRFRAVALTYVVLIGAVGIAVAVAAPSIAEQASTLSRTIPTYAAEVTSGNIAMTVGAQHGWNYRTRKAVQDWLRTHHNDIQGAVQDVGARAAELSANLGWLLLIPILAMFFLKDKASFAEATIDLVPDEQRRAYWRAVLDDLDRMLAQYIRAQLLFALAGLIAYTVFLTVVRFPYALGLGVMAGILEFIPFVGPAITAAVLFVVGFFGGYPHWGMVLAFVGVWRLVQDYVTSPYLMGEGLELHPLAAIFGVLVGGEIAGIAGMFLSIPVIAALRILWRNWQLVGSLQRGRSRADVLTR